MSRMWNLFAFILHHCVSAFRYYILLVLKSLKRALLLSKWVVEYRDFPIIYIYNIHREREREREINDSDSSFFHWFSFLLFPFILYRFLLVVNVSMGY